MNCRIDQEIHSIQYQSNLLPKELSLQLIKYLIIYFQQIQQILRQYIYLATIQLIDDQPTSQAKFKANIVSYSEFRRTRTIQQNKQLILVYYDLIQKSLKNLTLPKIKMFILQKLLLAYPKLVHIQLDENLPFYNVIFIQKMRSQWIFHCQIILFSSPYYINQFLFKASKLQNK
ncbi:unnamed protein product [Paramecium sonneborni]|uniref:Uncharacterized protein n=1 Tax=Paramecium sonneborni TaxID=65129 RepID=A0A8S1NYP8_9CILI|nr:unnamed protein product [Paramecium sonneborni]